MRLIVLLLFLPLFAGSQQRPNIIYIMSDDHDDDAISAYNDEFIKTPNIDRLAKEGMKFEKAFVGKLHLFTGKGDPTHRSAFAQKRCN